MQTAGDRDRQRRFDQIGDGRGVFTRDIERALAEGEIDAAVHSAKDLTGEMPAGLAIGAVLAREDARDALCGPYTAARRDPRGRPRGHVVGPPRRPAGRAAPRTSRSCRCAGTSTPACASWTRARPTPSCSPPPG